MSNIGIYRTTTRAVGCALSGSFFGVRSRFPVLPLLSEALAGNRWSSQTPVLLAHNNAAKSLLTSPRGRSNKETKGHPLYFLAMPKDCVKRTYSSL